MYCLATGEIMALFAPHAYALIPMKFLFCVNDYIEPGCRPNSTVIFTAWAKL